MRRGMERVLAGGASVVAALGLAGCSGSAEQPETTSVTTTQPAPELNKDGDGQVQIEDMYYPNGTRVRSFPSERYWFNRVLSVCDGGDLVEYGTSSGNGTTATVERSVQHSACADGRLTPSDFQSAK
jgi:hypothetical protein